MQTLSYDKPNIFIFILNISFEKKGKIMSEKRKNHTVPRSYLTEFSYKKRNSFYCHVYDKNKKKWYPSNIDNISAERDFYRLEGLKDPLIWENYYAEKVEPIMGHLIKQICKKANVAVIQDHAVVLSLEEKVVLAWCMVHQFLRGRKSREFINNGMDGFIIETIEGINDYIRKEYGITDACKGLTLSENSKKIAIAEALVNKVPYSGGILSQLLDRQWIIYRIIGNKSFITSDNPLMMINQFTKILDPFKVCLSSDATVCFFPISTKTIIGMYSRNYVFGSLSKLENKVVLLNAKQEERFIDSMNIGQIQQCYSQAYAHDKNVLKNKV